MKPAFTDDSYLLKLDLFLAQSIAIITCGVVQTSFTRTIYLLSHNLFLSLFVEFLVLAQLGFGLTFTTNEYFDNIVFNASDSTHWIILTWTSSNGVTDILISACMYTLLSQRQTGNKRTDTFINRMVTYSIQTGVVTSLLAMTIAGVLYKDERLWAMILGLSYTGVYSFVFLSNLHARSDADTASGSQMISLRALKGKVRKPADIPGVSVTREAYQESCYDGPAEVELHSRLERFFPEMIESCTYDADVNEE